MASGAEHYREGERLLAESRTEPRHADDTCPEADRMIAEAHAHFAAALAAATALTGYGVGYLDDPEIRAWREAAGVSDA